MNTSSEATTTWRRPRAAAWTHGLQAAFVARARSLPNAPAVICGDRVWSYGEIARQSALLAARLVSTGVEPHEPIAVVMDKGWEQVVAALGALFAGAGYLPVDPRWPLALRGRILRREGVDRVVTQPWLESSLRRESGRELLTVGAQARPASHDLPVRPRTGPRDAVAVFHTPVAGSDESVRVRVNQRTAVRQIGHINALAGVGPEDGLFALEPFTSPSSLYDLFGPLVAGGTILMPTPAEAEHPDQWPGLIQDYEATIWSSRPAMLRLLVDRALQGPLWAISSLRLFLLDDEVPVDVAFALKSVAPRARAVRVRGDATDEMDTGWLAARWWS